MIPAHCDRRSRHEGIHPGRRPGQNWARGALNAPRRRQNRGEARRTRTDPASGPVTGRAASARSAARPHHPLERRTHGRRRRRARRAFAKEIMTKKMLIDATHAEETRVVVVDGTRVEEFDFESLNKRQLAGNIYLAKVTRVEPSLQAAFVDYGGNRHGFLAFSEIHPDYYQIPKADREALIAEEAALAREAEEEATPGEAEAARPLAQPQARRSRQPRARRPARTRSSPSQVDRARPRPAAAEGSRTCRRRRPPPATSRSTCPTSRRGDDEADGEHEPRARVRGRRRRRRRTRSARRASRRPAPLQDPGGHQGPPDPAGAGRQGGARQQGRGADHLSLARRPLLRADAEHRARRRDLPQDHQRRRPQEAQGDLLLDHRAGRRRADHPHRRREPDQDRDQARLRVPAAPVGADPRPDAEVDRALRRSTRKAA